MTIRTKRVYDPPADGDGERVLIDRLWPRGLSKKDAAIDLWAKEIAPSHELRKWFGHDHDKWAFPPSFLSAARRGFRPDLFFPFVSSGQNRTNQLLASFLSRVSL